MRERWAWEWARANALIWTPAMENSARKAGKWYALHASTIDRPTSLKHSAYHEAGHAVIARVLGLVPANIGGRQQKAFAAQPRMCLPRESHDEHGWPRGGTRMPWDESR